MNRSRGVTGSQHGEDNNIKWDASSNHFMSIAYVHRFLQEREGNWGKDIQCIRDGLKILTRSAMSRADFKKPLKADLISIRVFYLIMRALSKTVFDGGSQNYILAIPRRIPLYR